MTEPTTGLNLLPLGEGLLADVAEYLDANDAPAPVRRYVAPGAPGLIAWDCEQLVVSLASLTWGINEDSLQPVPHTGSPAGVLSVRYAQLSVQLVRCTPTGGDDQPPAAAEIQAAGELFFTDAGLLSQCLVNCASFPIAHTWIPVGSMVKAGNVVALGPSGGYHGFEGSLALTVTGLT